MFRQKMSKQMARPAVLITALACASALVACGSGDSELTKQAKADNASCQISDPRPLSEQADLIAEEIRDEWEEHQVPLEDRVVEYGKIPDEPEYLWLNEASASLSKSELEGTVIAGLYDLVDGDFDLEDGEVALLHYPSPVQHDETRNESSRDNMTRWMDFFISDVADYREPSRLFDIFDLRMREEYDSFDGFSSESIEPVVLAFNPCGTVVRDDDHLKELTGQGDKLVGSELISAVGFFPQWVYGWRDNGYAALNNRYSNEEFGTLIMTEMYSEYTGEIEGVTHTGSNVKATVVDGEFVPLPGELDAQHAEDNPDLKGQSAVDALIDADIDLFLPSLRVLSS
ncbi:MAG: hypothetical protein ACTJG2_01665 [Candidatus Saccharimonadales bacterium]